MIFVVILVFLSKEPSDKVRESLIVTFEKNNLKFRIFCHQNGINTIVSETQLRMEMTSISPLGMILYSQISENYQRNAKKIISQKIDRLYHNANLTLVENNHSEINEDRLVNEDESYDDLNGYETLSRNRNNTQFTQKMGNHK